MFLTDMLFSAPRMSFSRVRQQAILSWAKELGADVQVYSKLHRQSEQHYSHSLPVLMTCVQDMSNPVTRSDMVFYPEDGEGRLAEVWNGDKILRDVPNHLLTANIRHHIHHRGALYFVSELVKRTEDRWFIRTRWIKRDGQMMAIDYHVAQSEVRDWFFQ